MTYRARIPCRERRQKGLATPNDGSPQQQVRVANRPSPPSNQAVCHTKKESELFCFVVSRTRAPSREMSPTSNEDSTVQVEGEVRRTEVDLGTEVILDMRTRSHAYIQPKAAVFYCRRASDSSWGRKVRKRAKNGKVVGDVRDRLYSVRTLVDSSGRTVGSMHTQGSWKRGRLELSSRI